MLAEKYPHLAEATINRQLKRQAEAYNAQGTRLQQGKALPDHFREVYHSDEEKKTRKQEARKFIGLYGGKLDESYDFEVRTSTKQKPKPTSEPKKRDKDSLKEWEKVKT
ncbi:MAG: hypothetical protein ACJ76N_07395 [Thermoanaerobaculia bacterium]